MMPCTPDQVHTSIECDQCENLPSSGTEFRKHTMCRVYKDTMWKSISTWYRPTSRTPIINVTSVKTKLLQWVWNLVFKRHRIVEARVVDVYKAGCRIRGATPSPPTRRPLTCEPHIKICQKTEKTQFTAAADASLCFQPLSTFVWSLSVCAKPVNCVRLGLVMCCTLAAEKWLKYWWHLVMATLPSIDGWVLTLPVCQCACATDGAVGRSSNGKVHWLWVLNLT